MAGLARGDVKEGYLVAPGELPAAIAWEGLEGKGEDVVAGFHAGQTKGQAPRQEGAVCLAVWQLPERMRAWVKGGRVPIEAELAALVELL